MSGFLCELYGHNLLAWKTPQGIPARISAASRVWMLGAQKKMVMTAVIHRRAERIVFLYPNRSDAQPLTARRQLGPCSPDLGALLSRPMI